MEDDTNENKSLGQVLQEDTAARKMVKAQSSMENFDMVNSKTELPDTL